MRLINSYACYYKDDGKRLQSSSGAVFSALAEYVLERHGAVYGVAMANDCYSVEYIEVTDANSPTLEKLKGSKYLQASSAVVLEKVRERLQNGQFVLFTGTGCQINGLKTFLRDSHVEYKNLICQEVVCHGVPSAKLWREYVRHQEAGAGGKMKSVSFRSKENGWTSYGMHEIFELSDRANNGRKIFDTYIPKEEDSYLQMFLRDYCLRPSCYKCREKKHSLADITIADFWGISKIDSSMNDDKGTSLVLIRTPEGQAVFDEIKNKLEVKEVSYEDGVRYNPSEYQSCKMPLQRKRFFHDMGRLNYERLRKKYLDSPFFRGLCALGRRIIKINPQEDCSGCGACYAICPQKAIEMVENEEGFLYPQINGDKCVECGKCETLCSFCNKFRG